MNNVDKKVSEFGRKEAANSKKKTRLDERDGLFEQHDVINRRLVSSDGRQLLREQNFEQA